MTSEGEGFSSCSPPPSGGKDDDRPACSRARPVLHLSFRYDRREEGESEGQITALSIRPRFDHVARDDCGKHAIVFFKTATGTPRRRSRKALPRSRRRRRSRPSDGRPATVSRIAVWLGDSARLPIRPATERQLSCDRAHCAAGSSAASRRPEYEVARTSGDTTRRQPS